MDIRQEELFASVCTKVMMLEMTAKGRHNERHDRTSRQMCPAWPDVKLDRRFLFFRHPVPLKVFSIFSHL